MEHSPRVPGLIHRSSPESSRSDYARLRRLEQSGSIPYTDRELIARRMVLEEQVSALLEEAEKIGLPPDKLLGDSPVFRGDGGGGRPPVTVSDSGSLEREERGLPPRPDPVDAPGGPCCTAAQIAASLVKIKAAYTALVAGVDSWKGCQDWATLVHQTVSPLLSPCWVGKFVWRIRIWPFGKVLPFGDGDTFIHHAYAICPCSCAEFGTCTECIVLDPYTITGFNMFQSANTYQFSEWIKKAEVWRATDVINAGNDTIYGYTLRYYCARARRGPIQEAVCRIVRDLLIKELRRYFDADNISPEVFDRMLRDAGLVPGCCP